MSDGTDRPHDSNDGAGDGGTDDEKPTGDSDRTAGAEEVEREYDPFAGVGPAGSGTTEGRSDGGTTEGAPAGAADDPDDDPFEADEGWPEEGNGPPGEDLFAEMGVDPMPEEDPLPDEGDAAGSDLGSIVPEVQESAPDLDVPTDEREAIVDKRRYCESCEHFSAPPEVACTHPRSEIREMVDVDHFRVHDCPVVARRRDLDSDHRRATDAED